MNRRPKWLKDTRQMILKKNTRRKSLRIKKRPTKSLKKKLTLKFVKLILYRSKTRNFLQTSIIKKLTDKIFTINTYSRGVHFCRYRTLYTPWWLYFYRGFSTFFLWQWSWVLLLTTHLVRSYPIGLWYLVSFTIISSIYSHRPFLSFHSL